MEISPSRSTTDWRVFSLQLMQLSFAKTHSHVGHTSTITALYAAVQDVLMDAWDQPGSPQLFTAFNTPWLFIAFNREIMGLTEGVKCDQSTFSRCWEESLAWKCQTKPRGTEKTENSNYWIVHNWTQFPATRRQTAILGNVGTSNIPVSHYLLPMAYSWKNMYKSH